MSPLHVGLNLVYWAPDSGGSGTYARELIRAIHEVEPGTRITAWVGLGAPDGIDGEDWGGETRFVHLRLKSSGSPVHVGYELAGLGFDARRRAVDVVHGLAYASPLVAPGVAKVVTILDLTWRHHPETVSRLARTMFGLLTPLCGRTADRIVAISEAVRDDLVATAGLPREKIDVTPLGVSDRPPVAATPAAELRSRLGVSAETSVVLFVGQVAAHKNLTTLVRALPALPREARLVLPGRATPHRDELVSLAASLGVGDRVLLPGFVSEADLEGLYALADCFVLPSTLEGFGLPILEAMRRGVPVACSDASSLPEVAGGAALLFDPHDPAAIAAAVTRVLSEPSLRASLVARGRARAAELTWERTARLTLASYRRAIERSGGGSSRGRGLGA